MCSGGSRMKSNFRLKVALLTRLSEILMIIDDMIDIYLEEEE